MLRKLAIPQQTILTAYASRLTDFEKSIFDVNYNFVTIFPYRFNFEYESYCFFKFYYQKMLHSGVVATWIILWLT